MKETICCFYNNSTKEFYNLFFTKQDNISIEDIKQLIEVNDAVLISISEIK